MPRVRSPRCGTLQFWPRKRAKRIYPRVHAWAPVKEQKILGFAGYKAGMIHAIITDNVPNSPTKGERISIPVTVIECPPLKALSIRLYKKTFQGIKSSKSIFASSFNKELARKMVLPKKETGKSEAIRPEDYADIKLQVYTQPRLIQFKKTPEVFEVAIGGSDIKEKFELAKNLLGKDIRLSDVFKPGDQVDVHAVSKGKGFQGSVKRFGIGLRSHKAEKTKRGPGNIGSWAAPRGWTVAKAGQMGFHTRTEFNKRIIMIGDNPQLVNPNGGFIRYGLVTGNFALIKGSVIGPKKRLVRFNHAIRANKNVPKDAPAVEVIVK